MKKVIIVVGMPLCGKNTQIETASSLCNAPWLDMGTRLRELRDRPKAAHESGDPRLARFENGHFVDDGLICHLAHEFMTRHRKAPLVFLTGVPRSVEQVKTVLPMAKHMGFSRHTIWFDTPVEDCRGRMLARGRADDTPETWAVRVDAFTRFTRPIRELLKLKTDFRAVDERGGSVSSVRDEIMSLDFIKGHCPAMV